MKMNRYWLFQASDYDEAGGLDDLSYTFKSLEAAKAFVEKNDSGLGMTSSWIVDSRTWITILRYKGLDRFVKTGGTWEDMDICNIKGEPK